MTKKAKKGKKGSRWTDEEETALINGVEEYKNKWKKIYKKYFSEKWPYRSESVLRLHWSKLLKDLPPEEGNALDKARQHAAKKKRKNETQQPKEKESEELSSPGSYEISEKEEREFEICWEEGYNVPDPKYDWWRKRKEGQTANQNQQVDEQIVHEIQTDSQSSPSCTPEKGIFGGIKSQE